MSGHKLIHFVRTLNRHELLATAILAFLMLGFFHLIAVYAAVAYQWPAWGYFDSAMAGNVVAFYTFWRSWLRDSRTRASTIAGIVLAFIALTLWSNGSLVGVPRSLHGGLPLYPMDESGYFYD